VTVVVDTNVPVVANGDSAQASPRCVQACTVRLRQLTESGRLALDDKWLILREYKANLSSDGQPGVGDAFLKWALTNYRNPDRCELVSITPTCEEPDDFVEFPSSAGLASFDPDDRKFVAVAVSHRDRPPILQAVDTKWWELSAKLEAAGVIVDFLCPHDMSAILRGRR
jgi:hypothetical protein